MGGGGVVGLPEPTPQWIEWAGTWPCGSISLLKAVRNQKVAMLPPFDIFKVESSGLRWMEVAVDFERAKGRVEGVGASSPGEYMIFNHNPGEKISIKTPTKRDLFQIGYDGKGMNARAGQCRRVR